MNDAWLQSTIWSEIDQARAGESAAMSGIVRRYRPALVAYFRGRGADVEDAEDLAQDVFLSIVRGDVLSKAHPEKGRFRSLLLSVAKHVASNEYRARKRIRRGGGRAPVSIDPARLEAPAAKDGDFDRAWVRGLMVAALGDLEGAHPRHARALALALEGRSQEQIAAELACTAAAVNNYVHRAKAFLKKRVRHLVAESCLGEGDFREEVAHLAPYLD